MFGKSILCLPMYLHTSQLTVSDSITQPRLTVAEPYQQMLL